MQKPDASNEAPYPLYQPMKPDARDYSSELQKQHLSLDGDKKAPMQYSLNAEPLPAHTTSKGFSFARLSKRTKIIAAIVLCIIIFVAVFVPAYITTHNNSVSSTATNTSTTGTSGNSSTASNMPKDGTIYRISIAGGRNGCNQFLSVGDCQLGNLVDMYSGDDDSGRQHWLFNQVAGRPNVYTISIAGGRAGCATFLSTLACPWNNSTLFGGDGETGLQEWEAVPVANTSNVYNFLITKGRPTCNQYLSTADCTNSSNLVDIYGFDDGSGRQRWALTPV